MVGVNAHLDTSAARRRSAPLMRTSSCFVSLASALKSCRRYRATVGGIVSAGSAAFGASAAGAALCAGLGAEPDGEKQLVRNGSACETVERDGVGVLHPVRKRL